MTSQELADKILEVCEEATGRVLGVGNEQYADEGGQMFESETVEDTLLLLEEELLDQINYTAMTIIKLRSRRA